MTRGGSGRPGLALAALVAIAVITAAWWVLALWPAGAATPEWLARTRAACFGVGPRGLPDAGGWILLVGEPTGMVGLLVALWGRSLRADLNTMRTHRAQRLVGSAFAAVVIVTGVTLGVRVTRAYPLGRVSRAGPGVLTRLGVRAPAIALTDQQGRRVTFADFRDRGALVTFAYGHCTTVCPTAVRDVQAARQRVASPDLPLLVITLDPWRDTPDRLPTLAAHWDLDSADRILSGEVADVSAALDALGIGRQRDTTTGDIVHGETVMLLDVHGKIAWRVDGGGGVWRLDDLLRARKR